MKLRELERKSCFSLESSEPGTSRNTDVTRDRAKNKRNVQMSAHNIQAQMVLLRKLWKL